MGRQRKPSHIRLVEGTGSRRAGAKGRAARIEREPVPPGRLSAEDPPADFSDEEKRVWREVLEAAPMGLLRRLDSAMLRIWCVAFVTHMEAHKKLRASSLLVKSGNGTPMNSPYLSIMNRQATIMKAIAAEMGFSPAARTRVSVEDGEVGSDPTDRFFK